MNFTSLLAQITKDKKLEERAKQPPRNTKAVDRLSRPKPKNIVKHSKRESPNHLLHGQRGHFISDNKDDIAAVRRLKEARRKERERLQTLKDARKGTKISRRGRKPSIRGSAGVGHSYSGSQGRILFRSDPGATNFGFVRSAPIKVSAAGPKMSFKELMKRAESIDKSQLAFNPIKAVSSQGFLKSKGLMKNRMRHASAPPEKRPLTVSFRAKPTTGAGQDLRRRQERQSPIYTGTSNEKKNDKFGIDVDEGDEEEDTDDYGYDNGYDYEDDDGFIVDNYDKDGDEKLRSIVKDKGYDRDEIWSIFNRRNPKRNRFDDYDVDDMEATGGEVLEEEDRALRQAKIDDRREAELLEQKRVEKLRRHKHMKSQR
ncbi:hypothetical protein FOA43_003476 [Brettanomyces nanus]|uniref:SPT2 chromatin protein n=1 Tax=Eeniella nana TaxID=13502 RepID=A0A875RQ77_EENNA|nr:uncharacterized protein FOA43_003476 [Brettanomyces nanus]QPG76090.1 hypothetical protein FOA43_003476 [Brettanomyces nanus]